MGWQKTFKSLLMITTISSIQVMALTIPTAPTDAGVYDFTENSVRLNFKDTSNNEDGFRVYHNGVVIGTADAKNGTSIQYMNLTNLTASMLYNVEIVAFNAEGESSPLIKSFKTSEASIAPAVNAPARPGSYVAIWGETENTVRIAFKDNSNNESGFRVEDLLGNILLTIPSQTSVGGYQYGTITGLTAGKLYKIRVFAFNQYGKSTPSGTKTFRTKSSNNSNITPIANAGIDQNVTIGTTVVFDAQGSTDSDGTVVNYKWTEGTTLLSTNANFNKSNLTLGLHIITLTITDNDGATDIDTLNITVNPIEEKNKNISIIFINDAASSFSTNQNSVLLEGFASSNIGIKSISCTNKNLVQQIVAQGTQQWSATMPLAEGDNKIECVALANDNITTNKTDVTIVYYPNNSLTSLLNFSEDTFFTDEVKSITAQVGLDYDTASSIVVKLYEVDDDNNIKPAINYNMYDNGTLPDEIDKDEIFTVNFTLNEQSVSSRCYRVGVTKSGESEFFSEKECINVVDHITQEEMQEFMSTGEDIIEIYAQNSDPKVAAQKVYDLLINDSRVGAVGINEDEESVWYVSSSGIAGGYHPVKNGQKGSLITRESEVPKSNKIYPKVNEPTFIKNTKKSNNETFAKSFKAFKSFKTIEKSLPVTNELSSKKGLIISPFINNPNGSNFGSGDDYYSVWKDIKNEKSCQLYASSEKVNNGSVSVTIDDFKNLSDYGYIHISTHGDNYYRGLFSLWKAEWGTDNWLKGALSKVVLFTGVKIVKDNSGNYVYSNYEKDIKAHRIIIHSTGLLAITPMFVKKHVKSMPNSIVVLSACRSAYNSSMANEFLAKGAKAVLGYTDYVSTVYAQNTTKELMKELFAGKNIGDSFTNTIVTHGVNDGDSTPAYFILFGSTTLELASAGLKNSSFEDATLTPWTKTGDGRIITGLGTTAPTDGKYMGIISTGLGYTTTAGSIEQTACLKGSDTELTFDWNFFSEEFKEYCGSIFQDTLKVSMCEVDLTSNISSNCSVLFERKVDDLCPQVLPVANNFDQGDVYATDWQTANVDISSYAGKSISLRFESTDVGDSIYDSAILIDNIEIQ